MIFCNGIPYKNFSELQEYLDTVGGRLIRPSRPPAKVDLTSILKPTPTLSFTPVKPNFKVVNAKELIISLLLPLEIRYRVTKVRFPSNATFSEEQTNQLNYNSFVHIMAEMIQKYAPKFLDTKEDVL